jgi:hypothetical protein
MAQKIITFRDNTPKQYIEMVKDVLPARLPIRFESMTVNHDGKWQLTFNYTEFYVGNMAAFDAHIESIEYRLDRL